MNRKKSFIASGILFAAFVVFTILAMKVDVKPIGPENSAVGFATVNGYFSEKLEYNETFYDITEVTGIMTVLIVAVFALCGLAQLIKRRSLAKVDKDIIMYGVVAVIVIIAYVFFEIFAVNYRPVVLEEGLENSYPSSHSMLAISIILMTVTYLKQNFRKGYVRTALIAASSIIMIITVAGRFISGVHWTTDIIGGILAGISFAMLYRALIKTDR